MSMPATSAAIRERKGPGGRDYGYGNARIRGMRSRLLDRAFLDKLIERPDLIGLIQDLSQTGYGPDLEEQLIYGRDASTIDEALKNNMVRTYRKVLGFLNDEGTMLVTTLLSRWDAFNLKTILRGKHNHLTAETVRAGLLPLGRLSPLDLDALVAASDVKAVVDIASNWKLPMAVPLREGFGEYVRSNELIDLEVAIDRYWTAWAASVLSGRRENVRVARRILGMQVDILNLVMVFRLAKENVSADQAEKYFSEGGDQITKKLYLELAAMSDIDQILDRLRGTTQGRALDEVAVRYIEDGSIAVFERALEDILTRRALRLSLGDPLGIGITVSYLWAKQNEITNLRIIVKGKAVGMPTERVRKELILV